MEGLCLQGEGRSIACREDREPLVFDFLFSVPENQGHLRFSLFAYSSLLMFIGLAKGNQFLLLATKRKKEEGVKGKRGGMGE